MNDADLAHLRRQMRARRRALTQAWRGAAERRILKVLCSHPWYWRASRMALFEANDGEPDLFGLLALSKRHRKTCYLPRIVPDSPLQFLRLRDWQLLRSNRFGIGEPPFRTVDKVTNWSLDLVLTPLVAFDAHGNRLGMGGGYYDRTFAFRLGQRRGKPLLLGVAWQCQRVAQLPTRAWDVPLDGVLTEEGVQQFNR